MTAPLKVLVVDDSAFMRKMVSEILAGDPDIEVVGTARDGSEVLDKVQVLQPDVVTMDVEMPNVSGDEALRRLMKERPTPVVMLSSLTQQGGEMTIKCLTLGAVDAIGKPSGSTSLDIAKISGEIIAKVKAAGKANLRAATTPIVKTPVTTPLYARRRTSLILIGSSTGGPKALQELVPHLPTSLDVPIVIVQHMPAQFTASLAERLDALSPYKVKEAQAGDRLSKDTILLAPGGKHMKFDALGTVSLTEEPPVHGVRPAIDVTIASLMAAYGSTMIGVLLTGMGRDGAVGLRAIKEAGGHTIAEHESSCVVYGMPKAAVEMNAAEQVLPLSQIPHAIELLTQPSHLRKTA
jgi:two-component system, chemotaxis family, protein-glutamate methylesterase/glutaminase